MRPDAIACKHNRPWVWYAPTLGQKHPDETESWMFDQFLDAGLSIAGIDVGETYGSPYGCAVFDAFYLAMQRLGYGYKPVLLGRSRGGLMLYRWAVDHPHGIAGVAGIYPVCNLNSYPGLAKAAPAYGLSPDQLEATLTTYNPIDRVASLARAGVTIYHIHGDADTVVPLEDNTALLADQYREHSDRIKVEIIHGGGHDMNDHWFKSQALVDFVIEQATN